VKDIFSGRTLSAIVFIFFGSTGLCVFQLRSLYLKDLTLLQTVLEQRSSRLDERMRRSVVAVDSLKSEMQLQLKYQNRENPTQESIEHQGNILATHLKAVPDALRVYYIASKKEARFFPENRAEKHEPSLLAEPFFQLGTPNVNLMKSDYWTKSDVNVFGEMAVSRATPIL
jgi:hypothetical protein